MKNVFFGALVFLLSGWGLEAQKAAELFVPVEIRKAIANQTRDPQGKPGKQYFQNRGTYDLNARFTPATRMLEGTAVIEYQNNSSDTLKRICFNLYQNIAQKGAPREGNLDTLNLHDGVEVNNLIVNGIQIPKNQYREYSTILSVPVAGGIAPGTTAKISLEWKQLMPRTILRRHGTYHGSSFFVAYWYPKICVYDDISGWNTAGYAGQAEFYGDYADYRVSITVPNPWVVWSSGDLMNPQEIFQPAILERLRKAALTDSVIPVVSESDQKKGAVIKSGETHTWRFKLDNQMDFAFALSDSYLWDASSCQVDGKRVLIQAAYHPSSVNYRQVCSITQKAIDYYTRISPGLAFPEKRITLFEGGPGGMEFPGMINQQEYTQLPEAMMVTVHELGHAYMPFLCGINEQKYGWMDEGIFTLIGFQAFCDQAGDKERQMMAMLAGKYAEDAGSEGTDIPMMDHSYKLGDFTYGFVTYVKPAAAFLLLQDYLGEPRFNACLREFMVRWKGRHPSPYDLFNTFNQISGEDLAWFWKPWFFEFGYADLAIGEVQQSDQGNDITILNKGGYPAPVYPTLLYADGTSKNIRQPMSGWTNGITSLKISAPPGRIQSVTLNPAWIPDADYRDNQWKREEK